MSLKANILLFTLCVTLTSTYAQEEKKEEPKAWTIMEWDSTAMMDKNMLPMYGFQPKTEQEKKEEAAFMQKVLEKDKEYKIASAHMVRLGYKLMSKDLQSAMYRFNHAYLFDSTNAEVYGGYAAVYNVLADYQKAKRFYEYGLSKDSLNLSLLIGFGTYYLSHFFVLEKSEPLMAHMELNDGIKYFEKAYKKAPENAAICFKLSLSYLTAGNCGQARAYYDKCISLNGQAAIPEGYEQSLNKKCTEAKGQGTR